MEYAKIRYLLAFFLLLGCGELRLFSQIKIGDNPATINNNSLVEMESTAKGFLAPRVAIGNLSLPAPLTAPVPSGMLVYSNGGAVPNGFYYWDGTKWLAIISSANGRTNFVLVKAVSDFPAPVGGIITLASNTLYEINGTITLTDRINLNNSWISGLDAVNDRLIYTPGAGEMFTGPMGGNIRNLTLSAPTLGSRVFNLDAGNANRNLTVQGCTISASDNIGTIRGYAGTVTVQNLTFSSNANGITYDGLSRLHVLNANWESTNRNTFERYIGTFGAVLKTGGVMNPLLANTATAVNVSAIASVQTAQLMHAIFTGNGTYVTGTFSKEWEVESNGVTTEKEDVAMGSVFMSTSALTNFLAVNTPAKAAGTTTSSSLFRFTAPLSNRLTYTGSRTRRFQVLCALTVTPGINNKTYSFYLAKNGVILAESKQQIKLSNVVEANTLTVSCLVSLAANDFIEIWAECNTDTSPVTVQLMNLSIR